MTSFLARPAGSTVPLPLLEVPEIADAAAVYNERRGEYAALGERLRNLKASRRHARSADRQAAAEAVANGEPTPPSQLAALDEEIRQTDTRRVGAADAATLAWRTVHRACKTHSDHIVTALDEANTATLAQLRDLARQASQLIARIDANERARRWLAAEIHDTTEPLGDPTPLKVSDIEGLGSAHHLHAAALATALTRWATPRPPAAPITGPGFPTSTRAPRVVAAIAKRTS